MLTVKARFRMDSFSTNRMASCMAWFCSLRSAASSPGSFSTLTRGSVKGCSSGDPLEGRTRDHKNFSSRVRHILQLPDVRFVYSLLHLEPEDPLHCHTGQVPVSPSAGLRTGCRHRSRWHTAHLPGRCSASKSLKCPKEQTLQKTTRASAGRPEAGWVSLVTGEAETAVFSYWLG